MPDSALTIHLIVPGLLGPMPAFVEEMNPSGWPRMEKLLSKSRPNPCRGDSFESTLFSLFGIETEVGRDLPAAAYRRIGDGARADDRFWFQITPVYLRPDQDRLLLFGTDDLALTQDEADRLVGLFNQHFADNGWALKAVSPGRWYLALDAAPDMFTHEVTEVIGRNIDPFLPKGPDGKKWHAILNEIQMLFYTASVNDEREQLGKAPINGLWFSGGGYAQDLAGSSFSYAVGSDPLLNGLATCSALSMQPLPQDPNALFNLTGHAVVLYEALQSPVLRADPYDWVAGVSAFESWISVVADGVSRGALDKIMLYPCNGQCYQLDKSVLRRFWKRRRPMQDWLDANPTYAD